MKYEDVPQSVEDIFVEVRDDVFPELAGARIKLTYCLKPRKTGEAYKIATIQKLNELDRYFSADEADSEEGFDYVIIIDKLVWEECSREDQVRIMRHELRHTNVDFDKKMPYGLRKHDYEDFVDDMEIELQPGGDPRWHERLGDIASQVHERDKEKED